MADAAFVQLVPEDLILCADGGLRHALRWGVRPDALIGDGDSGGVDAPQGVAVVALPERKDITDTHACVDYGLARGCEEFLLLGCIGGARADHFLANLGLLEYCRAKGARARMMDARQEIFLHEGGVLRVTDAGAYAYVSVFPLEGKITGVTLWGLAYPLQNAVLRRDFPMGVSNAPVPGETVVIEIGGGRALIILSERNREGE